MNKLIISTEAELLAAKDKDGNIIFDGSIELAVSVLFSHGVGYISASGYISARDISASGYIKTSCLLGIKFTVKLSCKAVVPNTCASWDREFWAARFGIDTSTGCWDEFVERLAVVAPKLLKNKHWLPIEKLMLESSLGMYREQSK